MPPPRSSAVGRRCAASLLLRFERPPHPHAGRPAGWAWGKRARKTCSVWSCTVLPLGNKPQGGAAPNTDTSCSQISHAHLQAGKPFDSFQLPCRAASVPGRQREPPLGTLLQPIDQVVAGGGCSRWRMKTQLAHSSRQAAGSSAKRQGCVDSSLCMQTYLPGRPAARCLGTPWPGGWCPEPAAQNKTVQQRQMECVEQQANSVKSPVCDATPQGLLVTPMHVPPETKRA